MLTECRVLNFAQKISNLVPRGKGVCARIIGRYGKKWIHHSVTTRHGARLPVVPDSLDVFVSFLNQDNSVDYWVFRIANAMLETNGICYDVGANVGYIALEIANLRASDNVMVYAFEPQPELARNIKNASKINSLNNLVSKNLALGDRFGEAGFVEKSHSVHGVISNNLETASYKVPIDTIDRLVECNKLRLPDVIKIDVEGFEYAVLSGAKKVIRENKPTVIFEMTSGTIDFDYSPKLLADFFSDTGGGYSFFGVKGDKFDLENYLIIPGTNIDVVAIPLCRMDRFHWFIDHFESGKIDKLWDSN